MASTRTVDDAGLERVLFHTTRTGRTWGAGAGTYVTLASWTLAADALKPGAAIKLRGLLQKYATHNGGWAAQILFTQGGNTVTLVSVSAAATTSNLPLEYDLVLSSDRKWGFSSVANPNLYGTSGNIATGFNSTNLVSASFAAAYSPRAKGTAAAFASYTAPPTVETVLIDFSEPVTITIKANPLTTDSVELLWLTMSAYSRGRDDSTLANSKSTICPGDSLTEGTGSTTGNDWISVLGRTRPGRPLLNEGLGGQLITSIVDRVVADPIAGKYWDMVFWGGINDASADGPAWWATISAQITRLMAFRGASARTPIFLNLHENTGWSAGIKSAATYVNTQLLAAYPSNTVDVATAINGTGAYYADAIHLTDSGYAVVAGLVNAKMTALSWT